MIDDWPTRDLVTHRVAATPDRTAVIDDDTGRSWTYREFDAAVGETAARLREVGVEGGDRVGTLLSGGVALARLFHAAARIGAALVPLNVRLPAERLRSQADRAGIEALLTGPEHAATAADLGVGRTLLVETVHGPATGAVDADVERLPAVEDPAVDPVALSPDDEALVLFTSGTTGDPKGVRLTVGNLVASATASAFRLGLSPRDRWLSPLPTYHMGGLAPVVRSALYGSAVVLQRGFDADRAADVMERRDVTGVSLVPTALVRLLDAGWSPPASLRFVLLGGAPAGEDLIDRCEDRGVPVHPTYGLTETASQVATARPREAVAHEGTVGQPLVTTDVTVLDEDGDPCSPGERGEIVVDGPTVTPGYLDDDRTREAFGDHGLHTGDLGYRDDDGRLWIVGRIDDRIVTGGENVHPARVEAVLTDHGGVAAAAVVGLDDEEWGQRVAALVVTDGGTAIEDVEAHCRRRLADFAVPRIWGLADELPRTASGTVDREAVRERLRATGTNG